MAQAHMRAASERIPRRSSQQSNGEGTPPPYTCACVCVVSVRACAPACVRVLVRVSVCLCACQRVSGRACERVCVQLRARSCMRACMRASLCARSGKHNERLFAIATAAAPPPLRPLRTAACLSLPQPCGEARRRGRRRAGGGGAGGVGHDDDAHDEVGVAAEVLGRRVRARAARRWGRAGPSGCARAFGASGGAVRL
jgi:hypothetical protein